MADPNKLNTEGREKNAAQPLNSSDDKGPERYPSVRQDDAVETGENRSFQPGTTKQGAGDGSAPPSNNEGNLGPGGDPAEGKR